MTFGCSHKERPVISFYYWKTVFRLSDDEKSALSENHVRKLYIRYFDVNINADSGQPFPESAIRFTQHPAFDVVPVIYIRNEVFLDKRTDVSVLVKKTLDFVGQINSKNNIDCSEIQIDCDWSLASRDNYLKFVKIFKKLSRVRLSATIRLHQVKYFDITKIPDVDKGVLMYYNMGKIAPDSFNSIYDQKIAAQYIKSLSKYPLALNVALPVYSWAIQIRNRRVVGLRNKFDIGDFQADTNFVSLADGRIKVKNSVFKSGAFYREGDILKPETIKAAQLLEMADDLSENQTSPPKEIIFYDLDELNLRKYDKTIFQEVADRF
ncbi:MAG: hypothetical protein EOO48_04660 [Flavobacterium sp.]|nr:MAG: hypothetical protein EOO48_04660 [Flavobacterium sp.]